MNLEQLAQTLERMHDKALSRFVKKSICQVLSSGQSANPTASGALDVVYVECSRRGKEKLYDITYEVISQHPEQCEFFTKRIEVA